ncbi:MAG: metal transporter, partial [bacterium]
MAVIDEAKPGFGQGNMSWQTWGLALFPLVILAALVYFILTSGEALTGRPPVPADALQKIDFQRVVLRPNRITLHLINTGPGPVTIAQVTVNDAIWGFAVTPNRPIPRLGRAKVIIPYPWLPEDPLAITLISSVGLRFEKEIDVAVETPALGARSVGYFALIGLYVGVIPVYLGLLWLPFLARIRIEWMNFLISFTAGILLFLGVDVVVEAIEAAGRVGGTLQGGGVVTFGLMAGVLLLLPIGRSAAGDGKDPARQRLTLAYLISAGIGLHNFGEGVAIGAAYVLGEVALGALLIVGFTIHNATEGIAIVAPVSKTKTRLRHFAALGLLAGGPTVPGAIIGGLAYYDSLAALFFALGGGAIFYVIYQLVRELARGRGEA